EQVEYSGRRLARLNVAPSEVNAFLRETDAVLGPLLADGFEPAREQLRLATVLTLNHAYYQVRESESQTFFGLHRAETQAADLDDLLKRFVRILTQTFGARAGHLLLLDRPATGPLARPRYIEHGQPGERLIGDCGMRGRYASYWSYPISATAVIQFAFPVRYPWLLRELALLAAAAERCREAMERARLEREMQRLAAETRR